MFHTISNYRDSTEIRGSKKQKLNTTTRASGNALAYTSELYEPQNPRSNNMLNTHGSLKPERQDDQFSKTQLLSRKLESIENLVKELNMEKKSQGNKENEIRIANQLQSELIKEEQRQQLIDIKIQRAIED